MTIVCGICRAERVSWTAGEKLVCGVMNDWDEDGFILAAERMLARDAETCFGPWECEVRGDGARCGPIGCDVFFVTRIITLSHEFFLELLF